MRLRVVKVASVTVQRFSLVLSSTKKERLLRRPRLNDLSLSHSHRFFFFFFWDNNHYTHNQDSLKLFFSSPSLHDSRNFIFSTVIPKNLIKTFQRFPLIQQFINFFFFIKKKKFFEYVYLYYIRLHTHLNYLKFYQQLQKRECVLSDPTFYDNS